MRVREAKWKVAIAVAVCLGAAAARSGDRGYSPEVEKALEQVRGVKADMFARQSSVLGELPSAAELAAAQPDRLAQFRPRGPLEYSFTDAQRRDYQQQYANIQFKGRPRNAECFPVGISGVHVRDIQERVELVVVAVEEGRPADGKVLVNDIIVGANGRLFDDPMDPRPALGYALVYSQMREFGGKLTLQIVRGGKPLNVAVQLPVSPAYSRTWPEGCERTRQVAAAALRCVLDHAPPARQLFEYRFWTPLFLMASGDPEALELVGRWAWYESQEKAEPVTAPGGNCWIMGYNPVNLCEYYELIGDAAVLPKIRRLARQIELDQYRNIGTWGHGLPTGYGPINNCGLVCFMGLILAQECGVDVDQQVMARAVRFFGQFCGTNFPYGESPPGGRSGRMDNGMHSTAALDFHLLGEDEMAARWARGLCYMWMGREKGRAERIFPLAWGPLGACMAPPEEFHMHLNNLLWMYELMRTCDGGYVFTDYGSNTPGRFSYPTGSTAAIGLVLYLPQHRIRVTGARKGVFAQRPPQGLEQALELYQQKKWKQLEPLLEKAVAGGGPQAAYARVMQAARERLEAQYRFTLALVRRNLLANPALAKEQLAVLESLVGEKRPEMAELTAKLPDKVAAPPRHEWPLKAKVKPCFDLFTKSR